VSERDVGRHGQSFDPELFLRAALRGAARAEAVASHQISGADSFSIDDLNRILKSASEVSAQSLPFLRSIGLERLSPKLDLYTSSRPAPQEIYEGCAGIYQANQYTINGRLNPLDPRYSNGGGHFQRGADWFRVNHAADGAELITLTHAAKLVAYSLYFTNPPTFPAFAQDIAEAYAPLLGEKFGYTYLIAVEEKWRRLGLATRIFESQLERFRNQDCPAVVHEFFVGPVANQNSLNWHYGPLRELFGGVDTGARVKHTVSETSAGSPMDITYAQFVIPSSNKFRLEVTAPGRVRLITV